MLTTIASLGPGDIGEMLLPRLRQPARFVVLDSASFGRWSHHDKLCLFFADKQVHVLLAYQSVKLIVKVQR